MFRMTVLTGGQEALTVEQLMGNDVAQQLDERADEQRLDASTVST